MSSDLRHLVITDFNRHYKDSGYIQEYALKLVEDLINAGQIYEAENVLIRFAEKDKTGIEFHCMNAGSGKDLTNAINSLLTSLPDKFEWAVTYYDNPRISELAKYSYFPSSVRKIDDGAYRTYEMYFDLRVKNGLPS